jgi:GNAT superfamily N-acetyltransferase
MNEIRVIDEVPEPQEYCELRVASGLSSKDLETARTALPKSLYSVAVRSGDRLIGMGRVVGDGLHVQVVDIAVHPEFQKRGLSRQIMERITQFIDSGLSGTATVSLFADVDWLYEKFGFSRPRSSVGMFYRPRNPRAF